MHVNAYLEIKHDSLYNSWQISTLERENLYKTLSADGNPEFGTILKVIKALGLKLHAQTA